MDKNTQQRVAMRGNKETIHDYTHITAQDNTIHHITIHSKHIAANT